MDVPPAAAGACMEISGQMTECFVQRTVSVLFSGRSYDLITCLVRSTPYIAVLQQLSPSSIMNSTNPFEDVESMD